MIKPAEVEKFLMLLGSSRLKWGSGKLHGSCPLAKWTHSGGTDINPSFAVYRTARGNLRYNCLACGEKGKLIGLLWKVMFATGEFQPEAMLLIYDPYLERGETEMSRLDYRIGGATVGKAAVRTIREMESSIEPGELEMPSGETELLWEDMEADIATYHRPEEWEMERFARVDPPEYVLSRVGLGTYKAWGLGYDTLKRRWVFPCRNRQGELIGYTTRLCWNKLHCFRCGHDIVDEKRTVKKREKDPDAPPVYLRHCPFCRTSYTKYWHLPGPWRNTALYGIEMYEPGWPVILVEGSTDVLHLWDLGFRCPLGVFGASPSPAQADLIKGLDPPEVILMGDGDDGGRALNREMDRLLEARGVSRRTIELPDGKDPDDMPLEALLVLLPGHGAPGDHPSVARRG